MNITMGERLMIIEEALCELQDAVGFMEGFIGHEDEEAIERRERKYETLKRMTVLLSEMKKDYTRGSSSECDGSFRICENTECNDVIIQGYVMSDGGKILCERCTETEYTKDEIERLFGENEIYFTEWWQG